MKHLAMASVLLAAAGLVASAQVYRDQYRRANPVDRAIADLHRARSGWVDHHEFKHFDHAERELYRFRGRLAEGRFDTHPLDEGISELNHLANSGRINPRDHEIFARDLYELREFRARGGRFYSGYR
jgi:hypothetical protein